MTSCNVSLMSLLSCNGVNFPYKGDENHLFTNLVTNILCTFYVNPILRWHNEAQREETQNWSSVLNLNLPLLCALKCTLKLEISISPQIFEMWITTFLGIIAQIGAWNIPKMCMTINNTIINVILWKERMSCIYINEQRVRQSSISCQRQAAHWGIGTHLRQHLGTCLTSIRASVGLQNNLKHWGEKGTHALALRLIFI